jgi:hypothetical protein
VKVTLEQTTKAKRWSRGIALLFLQHRRYKGWVINATPRPLYPRERSGTHCTAGRVGPKAGLERCGKSRPPPTGIRFPDWTVHSELLYRLSYPRPLIRPNSVSKLINPAYIWKSKPPKYLLQSSHPVHLRSVSNSTHNSSLILSSVPAHQRFTSKIFQTSFRWISEFNLLAPEFYI